MSAELSVTPAEVTAHLSALLAAPVPIEPLPGMREGIDILRLDQIHPLLSGNKLFKLMDVLERVPAPRALVSVGGAHSNHLHALAVLARYYRVPVTALVQGYADAPLTPTMNDCQRMGMTLVWLDRAAYRQRYELQWQQEWASRCDALWIGEGGALADWQPAAAGPSRAALRLAALCQGYDRIWMATGSGTTAALLWPLLGSGQRLMLVHTVADQGELQARFAQAGLVDHERIKWVATPGQRFGRLDATLRSRLQVSDAAGLPLDPVYGVRLIMALESWIAAEPDRGERMLVIHGGGLQGRRASGLSWADEAFTDSWLASDGLPVSSVVTP